MENIICIDLTKFTDENLAELAKLHNLEYQTLFQNKQSDFVKIIIDKGTNKIIAFTTNKDKDEIVFTSTLDEILKTIKPFEIIKPPQKQDVDSILDKINKNGIESLSEIEKGFLNQIAENGNIHSIKSDEPEQKQPPERTLSKKKNISEKEEDISIVAENIKKEAEKRNVSIDEKVVEIEITANKAKKKGYYRDAIYNYKICLLLLERGGYAWQIGECYENISEPENAITFFIQCALIRKGRLGKGDERTIEAAKAAIRLSKEIGYSIELPQWISELNEEKLNFNFNGFPTIEKKYSVEENTLENNNFTSSKERNNESIIEEKRNWLIFIGLKKYWYVWIPFILITLFIFEAIHIANPKKQAKKNTSNQVSFSQTMKFSTATFTNSYEGNIGGKYPIIMRIYVLNGKITGYYFYKKQKKHIEISGQINNNDELNLTETVENKITGFFNSKNCLSALDMLSFIVL